MRKWVVKCATYLAKVLFYRRAQHFNKSLNDPVKSQQQVFHEICFNLKNSLYGETLNLSKHISYSEFSSKVPIIDYSDIADWIDKQKNGIKHVLTPQPVKYFEKTSGNTNLPKYIPYNAAIMQSFYNMFCIWAYDLLNNLSLLETGKIFMSISPSMPKETKKTNKIPIGINDDSRYLHTLSRLLIKPFLIHPPRLENIKSIDEFRYVLAAIILAEENLEIISIWNPSYFLILLNTITQNREQLIKDFSFGKITFNKITYKIFPLSLHRKNLLLQKQIPWAKIWPNLKFISCWNSGVAKIQSHKLSSLFPNVIIQGKGLLATEAPMTIPLIGIPGHVPLVNEVFFEFIANDGSIKLLHQLTEGDTYQLLISQKGGLYRYNIGDRVKVSGKHLQTPCLEFVGRTNSTSDLVGEKLTEENVLYTIESIFGHKSPFLLLAPQLTDTGLGQYVLLSDESNKFIISQIEKSLCANYHYSNARILGQLLPVVVFTNLDMKRLVHDFFNTTGMKLGDIKDRVLLTDISLADKLINYVSKYSTQQGAPEIN